MKNLYIKKAVNSVLQVILMIICITMFCYAFTVYVGTHKQIKLYSNVFIDNKYIQITDNYDSEGKLSFGEFLQQPDSLEKMKLMYEDLANNDKLEYFEVFNQPIEFIGEYTNPSEFISRCEGEPINENDETEGNVENKIKSKNSITPLKSIQISEKTSEFLELSNKVIEGTYFENDDYTLEDSDEGVIPALVGAKYKEIYNLGDEIKICYIGKEFTLRIKGFLCEDTGILVNNTYCNLDDNIIIPSINYNCSINDKADEEFNKIMYSIKSTAYVRYDTNDDYETAVKEIEALAKKHGVEYTYIPNELRSFTKNSAIAASRTSKITLGFSVLVMLLMGFTIVFITIKSFDNNLKTYSIHLMNGAKVWKIKVKVYGILCCEWVVSLFIAFYYCKGYFKSTLYYICFFQSINKEICILAIFMMMILLLLEIYIRKINICLAIRRKE